MDKNTTLLEPNSKTQKTQTAKKWFSFPILWNKNDMPLCDSHFHSKFSPQPNNPSTAQSSSTARRLGPRDVPSFSDTSHCPRWTEHVSPTWTPKALARAFTFPAGAWIYCQVIQKIFCFGVCEVGCTPHIFNQVVTLVRNGPNDSKIQPYIE